MSWNIKTPGDYINGPLTVAGSATITGDLTVDTSTLKVDSANNRVGVVTATPRVSLDVASGDIYSSGQITWGGSSPTANQGFLSFTGGNAVIGSTGATALLSYTNGVERYNIGSTGIATWSNVGGVAGTAMTLNSTGLGVGDAPAANTRLTLGSVNPTGLNLAFKTTGVTTGRVQTYLGNTSGDLLSGIEGSTAGQTLTGSAAYSGFIGTFTNNPFYLVSNGLIRATIDSSGNVGVGVTPSAKLHVSDANLYAPSLTWNTACAAIVRSENGQLATGSDSSGPYAVWMQVRTIGNSARDISLNPLGGNVIIGSRTANNGKLTVTETANSDAVQLIGSSGNFARFYGWSVDNTWNANATAIFVGKQTSTSRSINAGGTVNASGADYAEYMTKGSDFVLSKGEIAGIDANGKLTNIFADAVSFVVKSTDPSYVGNDKWGVGLEGDELEAARQLVDRIAFAGQVPVNVTGAKAGDYIVPVVDGTAIKGIAVSNPTFEQYQLAVGKVIAIDADGRARIIVKIA